MVSVLKGKGFSPYKETIARVLKGTGFSPYIRISIKKRGFSP